ncbi:IclR family transcriptional regulator [Kocuria sp. LHG3120]|jgi:DNA-binding IclR family transcriptional regulator|uniref:IclR family transcriptional regulator n=1 Tax=Kocuria sp. LHG3120 TaxID=2804590 RepID=UPI003CF336AE
MEYNSAMRNPPLPERPTGAVGSLDRGLQLLQFLRDYGSLRVMDAAAHLNISRSSAHRLLQTLVYRGFAMQDEEHIYRPGPAMDAGPARLAWITDFRKLCEPHLEVLSRRSGESANLMIRVGANVRFLGTVRAQSVHATNDRKGIVMLAHQSSGGKALLAELTEDRLARLYLENPRGDNPYLMTHDNFTALTEDLARVRKQGFAVNFEETERGVAAVGMAVHDRLGEPVGAISVSTQTRRFASQIEKALLDLLRDARTQIERDLALIDLGVERRS